MKFHLITLVMFISISSFAQFNRGDKYIGGYFGLNLQNKPSGDNGATSVKNNSISISPLLGVFMNDHFAVGGELGYSNQYYSAKSGSYLTKQTSHSYSAGFFTRRYFPMSEKFFASITGAVYFSRGVITYNDSSIENKSNNFSLSTVINPSLLFFPSARWSIEARFGALGYSYQKNLSDDVGLSTFNLNFGNVDLGLIYYLSKE